MDTSIEEDASNDRGETLPANGQPVNMAEAIDHEALSYRAWQSPIGDFLAIQMERLAELILFTGATTPSEFADRLEVLDQEAREQHFDVGYQEGREARSHFA